MKIKLDWGMCLVNLLSSATTPRAQDYNIVRALSDYIMAFCVKTTKPVSVIDFQQPNHQFNIVHLQEILKESLDRMGIISLKEKQYNALFTMYNLINAYSTEKATREQIFEILENSGIEVLGN